MEHPDARAANSPVKSPPTEECAEDREARRPAAAGECAEDRARRARVVEQYLAVARVRGWTQAAAARKLGVSASTLSQVASGKYAGDVARIAERMQRALDQEERRKRVPQRPPFALTSVAEQALETLRNAHDEGVMAVIMGRPGAGKTMAVGCYCLAEPETVLITMRPAGRKGLHGAGRPILRALADALNVELGPCVSQHEAIEAVGAALRDTGRLVIIDEIDYAAEDLLQVLRMIHDIARCGMVFVATPAFLVRLRARKSSTLEQFLSRITYCCVVNGITDEDAERIAAPFPMDRAALATLRDGAHGSARRLANALVGAQRIAAADGGKMDAKCIARAYATLMEG